MSSSPAHEILFALILLDRVTFDIGKEPGPPLPWVRAILALLYVRSDGDRRPYDQFWTQVAQRPTGVPQSARGGYARTALLGIRRTLPEASQSVSPEIIKAVREAAYDREIVATKGHPHSPAARKLMDERLARGEMPDGSGPRPGVKPNKDCGWL